MRIFALPTFSLPALPLALALACLSLPPRAHAQARVVETEAIPGRPFGVGRVTLSLESDEREAGELATAYALNEDDGRALYAVYSPGRVRRLLGNLLGGDKNVFNSLTVYFLFTGEGPLELTVRTPTAQRVIVAPRARAEGAQDRLMKQWWREYNAVARRDAGDGEHAPIVETYLTTMLGRRLGVDDPGLFKGREGRDRPEQTLDLLMGAESLRMEALEAALMPRGEVSADRPVPAEIAWTPAEAASAPAEGAIEPIAMKVPVDSFYIRFGTFSNFLWLRKLMTDHGGNLGNMIALRGHDAHLNARLERQLAMRYSSLAELVGDQLFADVALVGYDLFQNDGAAMGMLYEEKSPAVKVIFERERAAALVREKAGGAAEVVEKIAGRDVPFLSTSDNRVRSFYAIDGKYHLITNSRRLVERFYECIDRESSLGASAEFIAAREKAPASNDYTIFAYFSRPFLQNLVGPQYQIELRRRLAAVADMQSLEMARLAGAAEKLPDDSIPTLVRAGLLPRGFGWRPEGGEITWKTSEADPAKSAASAAIDSVRGARGSFTPIPDVKIEGVTRQEALAFAEHADYYSAQWRQMDPLLATIQRAPVDDEGRERITIDASISLFAPDKKYGRYLSLLAPAVTTRVAPAEGDIVSADLHMQGGLSDPTIPSHHIYLGLQNQPATVDPGEGGWRETLKILQSAPGYLGAYPRMGLLDWLDLLGLGSAVDEEGYSGLPLGLWRRQNEGYTTLSFDRYLLEKVTTGLHQEETVNGAQVRVHAGDLSNAAVTPWVQSLLFDRARRGSRGNVRLFHALGEQLRAPVEDCPAIAASLLGADAMCPLGGKYETVADDRGHQLWISSVWPEADAATYKAPLLEWFRGADGWLLKENEQLMLHLEIEMQRKKGDPAFGLPLLNLFGGKKESADETKKEETRDEKADDTADDKKQTSPKQF